MWMIWPRERLVTRKKSPKVRKNERIKSFQSVLLLVHFAEAGAPGAWPGEGCRLPGRRPFRGAQRDAVCKERGADRRSAVDGHRDEHRHGDAEVGKGGRSRLRAEVSRPFLCVCLFGCFFVVVFLSSVYLGVSLPLYFFLRQPIRGPQVRKVDEGVRLQR
jgi:hypothetical protein